MHSRTDDHPGSHAKTLSGATGALLLREWEAYKGRVGGGLEESDALAPAEGAALRVNYTGDEPAQLPQVAEVSAAQLGRRSAPSGIRPAEVTGGKPTDQKRLGPAGDDGASPAREEGLVAPDPGVPGIGELDYAQQHESFSQDFPLRRQLHNAHQRPRLSFARPLFAADEDQNTNDGSLL